MHPTAYKSKVKQKSKNHYWRNGESGFNWLRNQQNADAILVHHGYFGKVKPPCIRGMKGKRIKALLVNDINLYGYHLPLDVHQN